MAAVVVAQSMGKLLEIPSDLVQGLVSESLPDVLMGEAIITDTNLSWTESEMQLNIEDDIAAHALAEGANKTAKKSLVLVKSEWPGKVQSYMLRVYNAVSQLLMDSENIMDFVEKKYTEIEGSNIVEPFRDPYVTLKSLADMVPAVTKEIEATFMSKKSMCDEETFDYDKAVAILKSMAQTCMGKDSHYGKLGVASRALKSLVAKNNKEKGKKVSSDAYKNDASVSGLDRRATMSSVLAHVEKNPDGMQNVTTDKAVELTSDMALRIDMSKLLEELRKHKLYKPVVQWGRDKATAKETNVAFIGNISQAGFVITLRKLFKDSIGNHFFNRFDCDNKLQKILHSTSVVVADESTEVVCGIPAYGMSQCTFLAEGKMLVVGIKMNTNVALAAQLKELHDSSGAKLVTLMTDAPNFCMTIKPGDFCVFPSGFILLTCRFAACVAFTWSMFPDLPGELSRVHQGVAQLCETYSSLRSTPYGQFLMALDSRAK
jgi:hypothetical protein